MQTKEQLLKKRRYERVCAYVDLDAILFNMRSMHMHLPKETKITAVVKTDAYGHGSIAIAKELEKEDYLWGYATATEEEAMQLRAVGIKKPVLILGYSFPCTYEDIAAYEIRPAVFSVEMAKELSRVAVQMKKNIFIHIKVDTGMGRIGVRPDKSGLDIVQEIAGMPGLEIEGIFTHFSKADEADKSNTKEQYRKFTAFCENTERMLGKTIAIHHCANSAGIVELPDMHMDMVRAGITLYGLWPSEEVSKEIIALEPVMSIKSRIVYVKHIYPGETVSYGGTYTAESERVVATIPVGYGDGYPRSLSGTGSVLIAGKRCPILGRICMDQFMVDITDVTDVGIGTEVTLLGQDGDDRITMEELGKLSGRFNYELACDIGKRVPRVFIKDGAAVAYKDYYEDVRTVYL